MGAAYEQLQAWDSARFHFERAVELRPAVAAGHNNLASVLIQQGQVAEGIAAYREALRLDPNYFDAHINLGAVLAQQRQFGEAVSHFQRATSIRPASLVAHNYLSLAYADLGRLSEAIEAAQRAEQLARRAGREDLAMELRDRIAAYHRQLQSRPL